MHNVSTTVSVKDEEWAPVTDWMWENRETYSGIALLPYDGHSYVQAPFESISEVEYNKLSSRLHAIDLTAVKEGEDNTVRQQEIACSAGGQCSL